MHSFRSIAVVLSILSLSLVGFAKDKKLTAAELIEKHLASIGTKEALATNHSRYFMGAARVKPLVDGPGFLHGKALFMSDTPDKVRLQMQFNSPDYPNDEFMYNGDSISIIYIQPGTRSRLGEFLYQREPILKDGLLGGTLSSAWPLLDVNGHKARIKYDGLKKVDGRELHQLSYYPRKNADELLIKLYFDPETFHHVKSVYSWVRPQQFTSNIEANAGMRQYHHRFVEDFSEFRTINGITVPTRYSFKYSADSDRGTAIWAYDLTFDSYDEKPIPDAPAAPAD